jgi:hypothetical protein
MAKALEVNENSAGGKPAQSPSPAGKAPSGEKPAEHTQGGKPQGGKVQGKSLQVNENSVEDAKPDRS